MKKSLLAFLLAFLLALLLVTVACESGAGESVVPTQEPNLVLTVQDAEFAPSYHADQVPQQAIDPEVAEAYLALGVVDTMVVDGRLLASGSAYAIGGLTLAEQEASRLQAVAAGEAWVVAGHTAPDGYVPPVSQAGGGAPQAAPVVIDLAGQVGGGAPSGAASATQAGGGCPPEGCLLIPVPQEVPTPGCYTLTRKDSVVETYCP